MQSWIALMHRAEDMLLVLLLSTMIVLATTQIFLRNVFDFGFDVLPRYAGQMKGYIHEGYHRDIGTLLTLEQARLDVERGILGVR